MKKEDLNHKDKFVKHWMNYFKKTITDENEKLFNYIIKVMDNKVDISKFESLIEQTKDLSLDQKNLLYLALLARLWTNEGNEWIYELIVQKTSTFKYSYITENFTHIYKTDLKQHIVSFVKELDAEEYKEMLLDCGFNQFINDDEDNMGQKYMCILSFLARYYSDIVNKEYFKRVGIPHLDIYFGTNQAFIDKLNQQETAFEIAQSTSWNLETAVNFAQEMKKM